MNQRTLSLPIVVVLAVVAALALLLIMPSPVAAANWGLGGYGGNPDCGATIAACITTASAGDVIFLPAGPIATTSVNVNKNLTFVGAGMDVTVVGPSAPPPGSALFQIVGGNNATFRDLTISNAPNRAMQNAINPNPVVITLERVALRDNRAGSDGSAVYLGWGYLDAVDSEFTGNDNRGSSHTGGALYIGGNAGANLDGCLFYDNRTDNAGGAISAGASATNYLRISNTDIISNTGNSAVNGRLPFEIENTRFLGNDGLGLSVAAIAAPSSLVNSIFADNTGGGMWFDSSVPGHEIFHVTFGGNGGVGNGLYMRGTGSGFSAMNNIYSGYNYGLQCPYGTCDVDYGLFGNNATGNYVGGAGLSTSNLILDEDPIFMDPANYDFRLHWASPAIDAGTDAGVYFDYDGALRPQGITFDLGAFEAPPLERDLALRKTASSFAFPGDTLSYEVTVWNIGEVTATNVIITDTFENWALDLNSYTAPAGFPGADCTPPIASASFMTCTVPTLPVGSEAVFDIVFDIDAAAPLGVSVENEATVNSDLDDENPSNDTDDADTSLVPIADVAVFKSGPASVVAGDLITYTILVMNFGPSQAELVEIKDDLPVGVWLVDSSVETGGGAILAGCSGTSCSVAQLAVGELVTVTMVGRVHPGLPAGPITNTAYAFSNNLDPNLSPWLIDGWAVNMSEFQTAVSSEASVTIAKAAMKDELCLGAYGIYELVIENEGLSTAQMVTVTDTLSDALVVGGYSPECTASGQDVTCTLDSLGPGESYDFQIGYNMTDTVVSGTTIANVAMVDADNQAQPANSLPAEFDAVYCDLPPADMTVEKTTTDPWVAGTEGTVRITVTNQGPNWAEGVAIFDPAYYGAEFVGFAEFDGSGRRPTSAWVCDAGVSCKRIGGAMPPNTSEVLELYIVLPADIEDKYNNIAPGINDVYVAADNPDPDLGVGPGSPSSNWDRYEFEILTDATLGISKQAMGDTIVAGGDAQLYSIVVWNDGPSAAYNVVVADTPAAVLFSLEGSLAAGSGPMLCGGNTCTINRLLPGESATIFAAVKALSATPPGPFVGANQACVTGASNDVFTTPCAEADTNVVVEADLAINKLGPKEVNAGDTFTYTVFVYNNGPSDAQNVVIIDSLPTGVTFDSDSLGLCVPGLPGQVNCAFPPGVPFPVGVFTFEIYVTADPSFCYEGKVNNDIVISSANTPDPNMGNNLAHWGTVIFNNTDLTIDKVVNGPVVAGGTAEFELTVTNVGPGCATDVVVHDLLSYALPGYNPPGMYVVGFDTNSTNPPPDPEVWHSCDSSGVCFRSAPMEPGTVDTIALTVQVPADAAPGLYNNIADVVWDSGADETVTEYEITTVASLVVSKQDMNDPVWINQLEGASGRSFEDVVYVITVRNDGPSAAANVQLTDTLPVGMFSGRRPMVIPSWAPGPAYGDCDGKDNNPVTCDLGDIPAGGVVEIIFTAWVEDVALCDSQQVQNDVAVDWDDSSGTHQATAFARTDFYCQGDLDLKKVGPDTVDVGVPYTYVLTVTNPGPSPIITGELSLVDTIPAGVTYVGSTSTGPCQLTEGTPGVWSNDAVLPAGGVCVLEIEVTATADVCPLGIIFNEAQAHDADNNIDQAVWLTLANCGTELSVTKEAAFANPPDPIAGDTVEFTVTVENTGTVTAYHVELTDNVVNPMLGARVVDAYVSGSSFYQATGAECTDAGYCNLPDIPVAGWVTIQVSVEIDSDQGGQPLDQQACAEAANAAMECATWSHGSIRANARMLITKQDLFDPVWLNTFSGTDDVTYVIEVKNNGPSDAVGVVLTDTLPAGFGNGQYVLVDPSYAPGPRPADCSPPNGANPIVCTLGDVPAGGTIQLIVTARVDEDAAAGMCGTTVTNEALMTWSDTWTGNNTLTVTEETEVLCQADVDLKKLGPDTIAFGSSVTDTFTYELRVLNTGASPIVTGGLTIEDAIPAGLVVDGWTATGCTLAEVAASNIAFTNTTPIAAGVECNVVITVTADSAAVCETGIIFNEAQAHAWNSMDQAVWVTQADCGTTLAVNKSLLSANAIAGMGLNYEITVENTGFATAYDVELTDNIYPWTGVRITNFAIAGGPIGPCSDGGFCNLDELAPGEVVTVTVWVTTDPDRQDQYVSQEACGEAANAGMVCARVNVTLTGEATLGVTKDGLDDTIVAGGDALVYVITVRNDGPSNAYDVVVSDTIQAGFQLLNLVPGNQPMTCGADSCTIPELGAGESVEIYAVVEADANTPLGLTDANEACIASASRVDDLTLDAECAMAQTEVVVEADLAVLKFGPKEVDAGDTFTYTVWIYNNGPGDAEDVLIIDSLPTGVSYVDTNPTGLCVEVTPGELHCGIAGTPFLYPVSAGPIMFEIVVTADPDYCYEGKVNNDIWIGSQVTVDPNLGNNLNHWGTVVFNNTELTIEKTGPGNDRVKAGELIDFNLTVTNIGPACATDVTVIDELTSPLNAPGLTAIQVDAPGWSCNGGVCQRLDDMLFGVSDTITITALVPEDVDAGDYTNSASATWDSGSVTGTYEYEVRTDAKIKVTKQDMADPVWINTLNQGKTEDIFYVITLQSMGPSMARNVIMTDTMQEGLVGRDDKPRTIMHASWAAGPVPADCSGSGAIGNPLVCQLGDIPEGETVQVFVSARVLPAAAPDLCETEVTNDVLVTWEDRNGGQGTSSETTLIHCASDLDLKKTGPRLPVAVTEPYTYVLTVTNSGAAPVITGELRLEDEIPPGLLFNGYTEFGRCDFALVDGTTTVFTNTAPLPAGQTCGVVIEVEATEDVCPAGVVFNEAQVHNSVNPAESMDQATWLNLIDCGTVLEVTKEPLFQGMPVAGTTVEFLVTISNTGNVTAFDVELTDFIVFPFPTGAQIVDVAALNPPLPFGACTTSGYCNLGDLAPLDSITLVVTVQIDSDQANLDLGQEACAEADNAEMTCATWSGPIVSEAELLIEKQDLVEFSVVGGLGLDNTVVYVISIQNNGPSDAWNVVISDVLPAGMYWAEDWIVHGTYAGSPVGCFNGTCDLGILPAGETVEIHAVAAVNDPDLCDVWVTNVAQVDWETLGQNLEQVYQTATAEEDTNLVCQGDLDLKKTGPREIDFSTTPTPTFTYVLTVTNNGPSPIPVGELTLNDQMPAGVNFVTLRNTLGDCNFAGTAPDWTNLGALLPGGLCRVEIEVEATEAVCPAAIIFNEAQVHDLDSNIDQAVWLTQVDCTTWLSIDKQLANNVIAGERSRFDITIVNEGNVTAYGAEMTDNVIWPAFGARVVETRILSTTFDYDPNRAECTDAGFCNLPDIPRGGELIIRVTVDVDPDQDTEVTGDLLRNRAAVEADNADMVRDAWTGEIRSKVTLSIEKDDVGDLIVAGGQPELYIITVWNDGPSDAFDVEITDLPWAPYFDLDGNDLTPGNQPMDCFGSQCQIPQLAAGESVEIYALLFATPDAPIGWHDVNTACITAVNDVVDVIDLAPECSVEDTGVIVAADLTIDKTGPITVTAGSEFEYTITVHNNGPGDAMTVTVVDMLPYAVSYVDDTDSCVETEPGVLTCDLGYLPAGESTSFVLTALADGDACYEGKVNNYVSVSSETYDPYPLNNDDDWGTVILNRTTLVIDKLVSPDPVIAGEWVDFMLVVTNTGPGCATDVTVVDAIGGGNPAGLVMEGYDDDSSMGDGPLDGYWYTCSAGGSCTRAEPMVPGAVDHITLYMLVPAATEPAEYLNWADVVWDSGNATASKSYDVVAEADVGIVKVAPDVVEPWVTFNYEFDVTNYGSSDAQGIVVTDTLDASVAFEAAGGNASPGCELQGDGITLVCEIETLAAGTTADFFVTVRAEDVPSGTLIVNNIVVSAETDDPNLDNNTDSVESTVVQFITKPSADLGLVKTADPTVVQAGDYVTFTMVVTNGGPLIATRVVVKDALPPSGLHVVSIEAENPDDTAFCDGERECDLGKIFTDTVATVTLVAQVDIDYDLDSITNLAYVENYGDEYDNHADNDWSQVTILITDTPRADLALVKDATPTVRPGDEIDYTLTVFNDGPADAENILVTDQLPEGVTYLSASDGCLLIPELTVECSAALLAAEDQMVFTITVKTDQELPVGTSLENEAVVESDAIELDPSNNRDTADTSIVKMHYYFLPNIARDYRTPLADLSLELTIEPDGRNFFASDEVLFRVYVRNQGDAPAGPFWVDLYINPDQEPLSPEILWQDTCTMNPCYGIAWQVMGLEPGESILLWSQPWSYDGKETNWDGTLPLGTTDVFARANTFNPEGRVSPFGVTAEGDWDNNFDSMHGFVIH